jgi:septum formation inhibitor MinC
VVVLTTVLVTTTEVEGTPTVVVVGRLNAGAGVAAGGSGVVVWLGGLKTLHETKSSQ